MKKASVAPELPQDVIDHILELKLLMEQIQWRAALAECVSWIHDCGQYINKHWGIDGLEPVDMVHFTPQGYLGLAYARDAYSLRMTD
jgi:hypothetical protein